MLYFKTASRPIIFLVAAVIVFSPSICSAQTAETSLKSKPVTVEGKIANEEKIDMTLKTFFSNVFEKDYESAAMYMKTGESADKAVAKIEKWREKFMTPSNLKVLSKKKNSDGTVAAVVTFQYKNQNGVADIMREKVTVSAGEIPKIAVLDSFDKKDTTSAQQPVQISGNTASNTGGNDLNGLLNSLSGGGNSGGSAPNITSIISAIGSGGSGGGAMNIDPGTLMNLVTEMSSDPEVMQLATNPKIMAIAQDPSVMNTLLSGNMDAISKDPRIKELMNDPAIQRIVEKMKNKGGGSAKPSSGANEVDKLME